MSTRSVAMVCFALAVILSLLAAASLYGNWGYEASSGILYPLALVAAPVLALLTGLYLIRKTTVYY